MRERPQHRTVQTDNAKRAPDPVAGVVGAQQRSASPRGPALTILLGSLAALAPVSMDIYLVSMPSVTETFATSVGITQFTVSAWLIGFALGQIIYGPMSDRFGRRPAFMAGLLVYVASSLTCALAGSIETLIASRFFQAVGMCCGSVVASAVVRDLYEGERAARLLSYMAAVQGTAPLVAPIIGSWLHIAFGWRASFFFVAGYGLIVMLAVFFWLTETNLHRDSQALRPRHLVHTMGRFVTTPSYLGYAIVSACVAAGFFAFVSASSFVFLKVFHFQAERFGFLFGFCLLGNIIGAVIGGRLVLRCGIDGLLHWGVVLAVVAGSSMSLLAWMRVEQAWAVLLPMFFYMIAFALVMPQAIAGALSPFPHMAGNASALLGVIQFGLSGTVGIAVGAMFDGTARPMASMIAIMGVLAWLSFALIIRPRSTSAVGQRPHGSVE